MAETKIGKYKVVGEIGRGAMGIVYKGIDPYIGRTVAIKTIRFDVVGQKFAMEEAQSRFLREARSAGNLNHPNIVTVYEVGEDAGITFIAMEYIEGASLDELLASGKKFSLEEIVELVCRTAEGLESAHRKGIIHRDIKPGNILIDQEGKPHIVDFGIARLSSSTLTQANMVMGTPFYMSPEQIAGRPVDYRADIFSLGCIIYELLTSQKPFGGETVTTVIYKIINENPPPLRAVQKNLPEGLECVVNKALAKDPQSRYQSCRELIEGLRNYPNLAPRPADEEKKKTRRRFPAVLAASVIVMAAGVAGIFFLTRGKPGQAPKDAGKESGRVISSGALQQEMAPKQKEPPPPEASKEKEIAASSEVKSPGQSQAPSSEKPSIKTPREEAAPPKVSEKKDRPVQKAPTPPADAKKSEEKIAARTEAPPPVVKDRSAEERLTAQSETDIRTALDGARRSFDAGDFAETLAQSRKALSLDANHAEAAKLFLSATQKLASGEIKGLLDRYVQSLKEKSYPEFFRKSCSPDLYQKVNKEMEVLFGLYDDIQASASNLTVVVKETSVERIKAQADFFHVLTGKPRGRGTKQVLFEGVYKWSLEKAGENWLITDIQYDVKQK
jgi:serine/threonine protein kinase